MSTIQDRVRHAFTLSPESTDWPGGLRMATMVIVPLIVFLALDQLEAATWASVAALHVGVVDVGGAYVDRLRAGLAATAAMAATVVLATLVSGSLWAVVSLTMVWVFAGAIAAALGSRAARVGLVTAITFVVGAAAPAAAPEAWTRAGLLVIGGLWGVFVTVSMWPIRRDGPMRDAIADAFERIGVFVGDMPHDPQTTGAARARIAQALVAARDATVQYQRSHSGPDPTAPTAVAALDAIDTLELRLDTMDEAAQDVDGTALADALGGLADYCRGCASAVRAGQPWPARPSLPRSPGEGASADARTVREAMVVIDRALERLGRSATDGPASPGGAAAAEVRRPRMPSRLRAILGGDSIVFRHAVRLAAIMGLAQVVAGFDPFTNASWIPLTVLIVLKPDMGSTMERGVQRIVGTVVGALAAIAAVDVFGSDVWLIVGAVFVLTLAVFAVMPRNYGLAVIGITPLIILLFSLVGEPPGLIDVLVASTLVGGGLALLGGWLLWPLWQAQHLPRLLADGARRAADFSAAIAAPPPTDLDLMRTTHRRAERTRTNAESALQKMLSEPRSKWVAPGAVMTFCVELRSVVSDLTAMQLDVHTTRTATAGLDATSRRAVDAAGVALRTVGDRVEGGPPVPRPARPQVDHATGDPRLTTLWDDVTTLWEAAGQIAAEGAANDAS